MRHTEFVYTWTCDLCGEQVPEEQVGRAWGENKNDRCSCNHFGVDICAKCQRLPIRVLLDHLTARGNNR